MPNADTRPRRGVLFINYYFSPSPAVGAIRNSKFAKYTALGGETVTALTSSNVRLDRGGNDLIGRVIPGFTVRFVPTFDYQTLKLIAGRTHRLKVGTAGLSTRKRLLDLLELYPLSLILGEGGAIYTICVLLSAFFRVLTGRYKAVYTSYSPFADVFCGYVLKLIFPRLRWVADLRDYPVRDGMPVWLAGWNSHFYRRILGKADRLTTVSEGLAEYLKRFHAAPVVLRNAFDPDDINFVGVDPSPADRFRLAYVGALYAGRRDPTLILRVLASCFADSSMDRNRVEFVYAGREGQVFRRMAVEAGVGDIIKDVGFVGRGESLSIQGSSTVLVMLTWVSTTEKGVLSSKFYEYLSWRKPVVCLVNGGTDSEIERMFAETGAGLVTVGAGPEAETGLRKFLLDRYAEYRDGKSFEPSVGRESLDRYAYPTVASQLAEMFGEDG